MCTHCGSKLTDLLPDHSPCLPVLRSAATLFLVLMFPLMVVTYSEFDILQDSVTCLAYLFVYSVKANGYDFL